LCKEHEGEVLKLFCETCDEAICRDCTIVKHREHKYAFVKDAFLKGKESVLKILSETKTKASVLMEALDAVAEVKTGVQSNAEQTKQKVFNCFQELTDCLSTRCNKLISVVEELKKAKLKSLELQQEELETALGSVWSSIEFTERALEHGSEVDILNMRKQMSARLQELNSARWQLEPISHDCFKFCPDYQLKQALPSFGDVTDVFTHAGSSTVTMGHGSEGVMYNTLNGQLIEFFITAKELGGEKRTEGGDVFEVEISTEDGETVCNNTVEDCGNGTYSFCFTPIHGNVEYRLSVTLSGCHVRGSPFAWVNKVWNLCTTEEIVCRDVNRDEYRKDCLDQLSFSPVGEYIPFDDIQLTENNMKATFLPQYYKNIDPHCHSRQTVFGSSSFVSGRHSWKVCISGNFTAGFAFGACGIPQHQYPDSQWTWCSRCKYQTSSLGQQSVITNCVNNDVIEFYLDCDNQTLMMYNQRTTQFDTWRGIRGRVCPMFILCCDGDEVSLPCELTSSHNLQTGCKPLRDNDDGVKVSLPCELTSSHNLQTGYKPLRYNDDGVKVSLPCKLTSSHNLQTGSQPLRNNESTRRAYKTGKGNMEGNPRPSVSNVYIVL